VLASQLTADWMSLYSIMSDKRDRQLYITAHTWLSGCRADWRTNSITTDNCPLQMTWSVCLFASQTAIRLTRHLQTASVTGRCILYGPWSYRGVDGGRPIDACEPLMCRRWTVRVSTSVPWLACCQLWVLPPFFPAWRGGPQTGRLQSRQRASCCHERDSTFALRPTWSLYGQATCHWIRSIAHKWAVTHT